MQPLLHNGKTNGHIVALFFIIYYFAQHSVFVSKCVIDTINTIENDWVIW